MKPTSKRATLRNVITSGLIISLAALPVSVSAVPMAPVVQQSVVGLSVGAAGQDVTTVQQALLTAGIHVPGGADGHFGPATRNAVLTFQRREGLPQTGTVDASTASALGLTKPAATQPAATPGDAVLKPGDSGDAVKELQQRLTAMGVYVPGGADGDYGPGTETAVTNFQRWNGLTQTGSVDAKTASALGLTGSSSTPAAPAAPKPPAATPPAPKPPAATPPAAANPYVGLSVGASGTLVKELQRALIAAGVRVPGGADGIFGAATRTALKSYQASHGHAETGKLSDKDVASLKLGTDPSPAPKPAPTPAPTPDPATSGANPYVGLHVGSRGALVKDLQQALIAAGISVRGGADGIFGLATKSALESYQRANGLGVSGQVFEATATTLGLGTAAPAPAPAPDPAPADANGYIGLKVGASGPKVKELQNALLGLGLVVHGGADGVFGGATKSALIAFQSVNGIEQTGVVTAKGAGILGLGQPATPPAAPATPSGIVSTPTGFPVKGESSERVRALQQQLISANINLVGGADGSFGNATASALRDYQQQHGLTVSGTVTQETADKLGLSPSDASAPASPSAVTMQRFPLQGKCYFGNTWHAPRGNNRVHEGVDIIAGEGKLLYAVVDGTITKQYWDFPGALAGNGLRVAQDNGTYFTYLHLLDFAPGIEVGVKVKAGDVIGFVGNTGSSATPHLHFEIHPHGGAAVNPYPYVKAMDDCKNTTPQYQSSFASGG